MNLAKYVKPRGMQTSLADAINVSPVLIHQWSSGKRSVPAIRCKQIELATDGEVKKHELRPDIFDAPEKEAA
jgi:DNA-binding transcriptional regulator YdaS (Cro superfamily)